MDNKLIDIPTFFKEQDPEREARIQDEIIIDAYDEEIISCWYEYLREQLHFPFTAMIRTQQSALSDQVRVKVLDMADMSRCGYWQMWVIGTLSIWEKPPVHFFLSDISSVEQDPERITAIEDWKYWRRSQLDELWDSD